jgi:hypothetical protein
MELVDDRARCGHCGHAAAHRAGRWSPRA